jgi:hypothetical protein
VFVRSRVARVKTVQEISLDASQTVREPCSALRPLSTVPLLAGGGAHGVFGARTLLSHRLDR